MRFSSSVVLIGLAALIPTASALTEIPSSRMTYGTNPFYIGDYYSPTGGDSFRFPAAVDYEGAFVKIDCGNGMAFESTFTTFDRNGDPTDQGLEAIFMDESDPPMEYARFSYLDEVEASGAAAGEDSYHATASFDITRPDTSMCPSPKLTIDLRPSCGGDLDVIFDLRNGPNGPVDTNDSAGRLQVNCDASAKADYFSQLASGVVVGDTFAWLEIDLSDPSCDLNNVEMKIDSDRILNVPGLCVTPGMDGDPHVKTWGGQNFDYMGECDLLLLEDKNVDGKGNDLMVQARTKIRFDYSYIESAAISLGGDILEVSAYGDYAVNGVEGALKNSGDETVTLGGYPVYHTPVSKKRHQYDIVLSPTANITLASFKDLVSIHFDNQASHVFFKNLDTKGLMGSFSGKLLARDGKTEFNDDNLDAFGQEWQVNTDSEPLLFRTARAPQFPAKCVMPDTTTKKSRRLGEKQVTQEAAELACGKHKATPAFENCVYDVLALNDLEMSDAGAM